MPPSPSRSCATARDSTSAPTQDQDTSSPTQDQDNTPSPAQDLVNENSADGHMDLDDSKGRTAPTPNPWRQVINSRRNKTVAENQVRPTNTTTTAVPARKIPPPRFPPNHFITVIRPHDGLRVGDWPARDLVCSLVAASEIPGPLFRATVTLQVQPAQNLLVAATPDPDIADRLSQLTALTLRSTTYAVSAYMKPPPGTARGVIHGIPEGITQDQLIELTAANRPYLIHARLMGRTRSALLTFNGLRIPYYIKLDCEMVRCRPYRRAAQTCQCCGEIGHRQDVCPHPDKPRCPACGIANPSPDHSCAPRCKLCDGPHATANKECPKRFLPVPQTRRFRHPAQSPYQPIGQTPLAYHEQDFPALQAQSSTAHPEDRNAIQPQVSWSDALRSTPTALTSPSLPPPPPKPQPPIHPSYSAAIAELKQQQQRFQAQLASLTAKIDALLASPLPAPPPPPAPLPEQIHALIDTKIAEAIKELIASQTETLAPICSGIQAITERQNKLEQTIQGIQNSQASTHQPKKLKHHPYHD